LRAQHGDRTLGQWRASVLCALPITHDDLVPIEVHVLDPQRQTLRQSQPGAIHQQRTHTQTLRKRGNQLANFPLRQHDRLATSGSRRRYSVDSSKGCAEHRTIQESQRGERLVLRRRRHAFRHGQVTEK
jgi:hypothetical protein